jgi:hypothetical protein
MRWVPPWGEAPSLSIPKFARWPAQWNCPEEAILGRAMAHELGHILLGYNSHSSQGLMRPHFGRKDQSAESARYLFEPTQAARLREAVRKGNH